MDKRYYDIAGHIVSLERPDDNVWQQMRNLVPFETAEQEPVIVFRQVDSLEEKTPEPLLVSDDEGFPLITIGKTAEGKWFFTMSPLNDAPVCCRCRASEDFSLAEFEILNTRQAVFSINNTMMLLFALRTAPLSTLEIHASVIMKDGRGFVFLGKSGTGKSTHSRLWLENIPDTELLNDDNPVIRVMDDGSVRVFGSPWSGKTPCYKKKDVSLAAIVRLNQAPFNRIAKLSPSQAYACLYPSVSAYRPERKVADGVHNGITGVIMKVPCYNLECLPDAAAAELCCRTIDG